MQGKHPIGWLFVQSEEQSHVSMLGFSTMVLCSLNLNWIQPIGILIYARAPFQIFSNDLSTVFKLTYQYSLYTTDVQIYAAKLRRAFKLML